jgi:hypothetical protein
VRVRAATFTEVVARSMSCVCEQTSKEHLVDTSLEANSSIDLHYRDALAESSSKFRAPVDVNQCWREAIPLQCRERIIAQVAAASGVENHMSNGHDNGRNLGEK